MKHFFFQLVTIIGLLSSIQSASFATHIVGGQFSYKCMGFDGDSITLELYLDFRRDCFNAQPGAVFDNPAVIGIYNPNGQLLANLGMDGRFLFFTNDIDTLTSIETSECKILGEDVCVETTRYVDTVRLPYGPQGYLFAYQRCCRNITLTNIVNPNSQGTTQLIELTGEAQLSCNSSPQIKEWPPVYVCAGKDFVFDHSAIDDEGDSLVYRLVTPFTGGSMMDPAPNPATPPPYQEIIWSNGYDLSQLLGPSVNPLSIDAATGDMTAMPNDIGQYLVGVCVEEYRNGQLLSKSFRDYEINVRICLEDQEVFIEEYKCPGDTLIFDNMAYPDPGSYQLDYETVDGCDSTVFLTVLDYQDYEVNLQTSICVGESVIINGEVYSEAGTYTQDFQSQEGCDSLIVIQITDEFNCDDCNPSEDEGLSIPINKLSNDLYSLKINNQNISLNKQQMIALLNQAEVLGLKNDRKAFDELLLKSDLPAYLSQLNQDNQQSFPRMYDFINKGRKGARMNAHIKFHK